MSKDVTETLHDLLLAAGAEVRANLQQRRKRLESVQMAGNSAADANAGGNSTNELIDGGQARSHATAVADDRVVDTTAAKQEAFDIMRGHILLNDIDLPFGPLRELDVIKIVSAEVPINSEIAKQVLTDLNDKCLIEIYDGNAFRIPLKIANQHSLRKEFAQRLALEVAAAVEIAREDKVLSDLVEINRRLASWADASEGQTLWFLYEDLKFHESLLCLAGFDSSVKQLHKSFHRINLSIDHIKRKDGRKHAVVKEHLDLITAIEKAQDKFRVLPPDEHHLNDEVRDCVKEIHESFWNHFITAAGAWHENLGPEWSRPPLMMMWV